jgi:hypothetical protein
MCIYTYVHTDTYILFAIIQTPLNSYVIIDLPSIHPACHSQICTLHTLTPFTNLDVSVKRCVNKHIYKHTYMFFIHRWRFIHILGPPPLPPDIYNKNMYFYLDLYMYMDIYKKTYMHIYIL